MTIFLVLLLLTDPQASQPASRIAGTIVVTPERGETEQEAVAASLTVLTRTELEALPAQSLAEVVNLVPGMAVYFDDAAAGAPMIVSRGFFGGGENEYVKLLVDGVPVGDVESGLFDWRQIRVADIERIEVLRGPGSSLYGDSAMGGVISVFTRGGGAVRDERVELRLSGGALDTREAGLFYRGEIGSLRAGFDGFTASTDGARDHAASRDRGGNLTLQHLGAASRLRLSASHGTKDREEPGPLLAAERAADRRSSNPAFRFDREHSVRRRVALDYDRFGTTSIRAVLHGAGRETEMPRTLLLAPGFGSTLFRGIDGSSIGGIFEIAREWSNASMRIGTDLDRASLHGRYAVLTGDGARGEQVAQVDADRSSAALFVTADWLPVERLRFSAGLRRDAIVDRIAGSDRRKSAWSPRFGATFRLGARDAELPVTAFIQLAHAFKAPTLDQLFDPRPFPGPGGTTFTVSNDSLLPQRARNVEVGVRRLTPDYAWSVAAYRMNVTDEIDFDPTFFTYRNIGSSQHRGVEASLSLQPGAPVRPMLTYAWTRVSATDEPDGQLKNIPTHRAQLVVRASLPRSFGATVAYRWEHERFADDAGLFPLPDVRVLDAKLDRTFGRVRIELDVRNVLDAEYSYVASILNDFFGRPNVLEFPAPGRTARVNLIWRY